MSYFHEEGVGDWQPLVDTQCCLRCSLLMLVTMAGMGINFASLVYAAKAGVPADYVTAGATKSFYDILAYALGCPRRDAVINND